MTRLLQSAADGDPAASSALFSQVYDELRTIADRYMRDERRDHTLGATALVHEAYLRLLGGQPLRARDRAGFFSSAAEAMRRILIEHARRHRSQKRAGSRQEITLDAIHLAAREEFAEILAVEEAVLRLEKVDADAARVVRLRFFAGLGIDEVAAMLEMSPRSVARDWAYARAWLYRALGDSG